MGWVKDKFFGGAEKKAAREQIAAGDRAMATQKEYYDQARNDIMSLFPQAYQGIATSYQQAIDQVGAGKASASDILRQAFSQSNQIQQSGSNAAISALLGRPQQMQLPQSAPQPMGMMQPKSQMMQTGLRAGIPNNDMRASVIEMSPEQRPFGQPQMPQGMYGVGLEQPQFGITDMRAGMPRDVMEFEQVQRPFGGVGMANPNQPMMQTTEAPTQPQQQNLTAPLAQTTDIGAAPQVQNNVDMSGIGLSGAEAALNAGMQGQLNALQGGSQQAQGTLQQTLGGQLGALNQGFGGAASAIDTALGGQLGALRQGFGGAEQALNQYGQQALGAAQMGFGQGRADIMGGASNALGMLGSAQRQGLDRIDQSTGQAINYLNPYASTGASAQQREAALSGALGAEAQQQAISQFMESPGQKFLRERQEQALLRNASATGGLRGGSTLTALQEQASGIAAQQQQQQLENLRSLAGRGQQAAGQQGQFAQSGGQAGANLIGSLAQTGAGIAANAGQAAGNMAASGGQFAGNLLSNIGQNVAGLRQGLGSSEAGALGNAGGTLANIFSGQGQAQAGAIGNIGGNVAGLQNQLGGNTANVFGGTANNLAGLRSQAGQQVAGQINQQTGQLSSNQLGLGQLLAGLDTGTANQIANLLTSGGTAGAQNQMNLATILANLATGQGSNLSQIQVGQGNAQAAGTVGGAAGAREGVGTATNILGSLFSDKRLKDNITPLADGPVGLFAWTWKYIKEIPESLRGSWSIGVIAQEVQQKFPDCVVERDGFLAVDYAKLAQEVAHV